MNNSRPFSKSKSEEEEEEKKLFCWSLQLRRRRWTINKLVGKLIRERERDGGQVGKQPGNGKVVIFLNGLSVMRLGQCGLTWH